MSMTIRYELQLLAASLTVGICLMMVYDGLRLFRTLIPHGNFWTGIEDAVYWAGSSITTFLLLFGQNDGILRWYAIFGVLMGMLVYNLTVSRILLRHLKKVEKYLTIRKIKRQEKQRLLREQKQKEKKEQRLRLREEKQRHREEKQKEKREEKQRLWQEKEAKKQLLLKEKEEQELRRSRKAEEERDAGKRKNEKKKERKSE